MKKIFIASRFEEFKRIRNKLSEELIFCGMKPIDLNDNMAVAHPPLERSLDNIRQSDIVILLIGDTYGTIPEGETKSYTHLEYEEALQNKKPVYVFGIGDLYKDANMKYSDDRKMINWQEDIESNQTFSLYSKSESIGHIVHKIVSNIYNEQNKVWIDEETGLMWQVNVEDHEELGRYKWRDLYRYKDNLNRSNYGGFSDWRIPEIDELETLITEQSYPNSYGYDEETFIKKPLVYSMSMKYGRFWSNTSNSKNIHFAYGINFNRKRENSQSKKGTKEKDKTRYIRCVRLWGNEAIEKEWSKISASSEIESIELFLKKYFGASSALIRKARNKLEELQEKREEKFASLSPIEKKILFLQENNKNTPTITLLKNGIECGDFDPYKCNALSMLKELMKEENKWKESSSAKKPEKDKKYMQTLKVLEWMKECKQ